MPASAQNGPFDISGALTTEDTRLTTGVESVSASGSKGQQHLLIDFMLTAPLGTEVSRTTKPAATAWLNARFNGATVNTVSNVKQFVGGFEDDLVSGDIGNLLNALTFRAGLEFKVTPGDRFNFGGDFQFQPTLIVGFGVQTVPALDAPSFFELPVPTDDVNDKSSNLPYTRWGIPRDKKDDGTQKYKYVALTGPDRRQFYGSWEAGLRLKTHHFNHCEDVALGCDPNRRRNFPGVIDLTVGQDSSVTGGERRGTVGKIDAFYPLPTDNIANSIYLFGSIRKHRVKDLPAEEDPIILRAPAASITLPSPEVFVHVLTADDRTRDDWKFGIGVDLIRLFTAAASGRASDEASAAKETGSSVELAKNDDVVVQRRGILPGETATFNHGVDVVIPTKDASLQAFSIPKGGSGPINFKKDEVRIELATKRQLKNTNAESFEAIVVKVKTGEGKAKMPDVKKSEQVLSKEDESKYRVTKVTCTAMCDFTYAADIDNSVAIVPLTETSISIDGKDAVKKKPYEAVVVNRKTALAVTGAATFVVVRVP